MDRDPQVDVEDMARPIRLGSSQCFILVEKGHMVPLDGHSVLVLWREGESVAS